MGIKKVTLDIPFLLYKRAKKQAELKGYENVEEYILDSIRHRVFTLKEKECPEILAKDEIKVLSEENLEDSEEDNLSYASEEIQRDLDSRGFQ